MTEKLFLVFFCCHAFLKEAAGSRFKVKKYRLHPTELAADGI